ncbi:MAG: helix-turn-helix domain-containing protein [Oscillospiraceae bacterium]|nr:helix-turn-helix domain-containing protein [Oscillospiraceae bacterium]
MKKEYSESYRKLGLNIAYYRNDKGLSQEILAELIDIKQTVHISRIENGKSAPSLDVIFGIAKVLDVPVYKLFEFRE